MRIQTGLRIFAVVGVVSAITAGFIACSGSDDNNTDVTTPDAGPDTSKPDTGGFDSGPADTGVQDTGPKDTGPQYDAGPPITLDGGDLYEGGVPCVQGGILETEDNGDPDAANPVQPTDAGACVAPGCSICGVIFTNELDGGADAGAELEYVSFYLHPTAKKFYIQYQGDVTLTISIEGESGTYTIPGASMIPFKRDKAYYVQVKANKTAKTAWRVTLFEEE